jgi:RNA polymerase sigma-70 factor, ECF subfamily
MAIPAIGVPAVDESVLVGLARAGDARARESLYRVHAAALSRWVRFLVHDAGEAEDLVQETFAAAFTSLWRFRGESSFSTWLHRIALNLARHHWRSRARARAFRRAFAWLGEPEAPGAAPPEDALDRERDLRLVRRVLDELSPKLREAFVLLVLQGLPGDQAAQLAGVGIEVLRVRATRARQRILRALRTAHGEES